MTAVAPLAPAILVGAVEHVRLRPVRHRLRYRMFQVLVDIAELPALGARLRLFSHEAANLFSLMERDHGDGEPGGLRRWVERTLAAAGIASGPGPVELLCMPRVLGYVFNPISLYFCRGPDGGLRAVIYEVNNTFGERHAYVAAVQPGETERDLRQSCAKTFHVSPFMPMEMRYGFNVRRSPGRLRVAVNGSAEDGAPLIHARFTGAPRPFNDRVLAGLLFSHPLLTLKVVAAIHLEALRLMAKGLKLRPKPVAPERPVSLGGSA